VKLYNIKIQNYQLDAILGVLDFERVNTQRIEIDFQCTYRDKENYIDYMSIANFIKDAIIDNKYLLIEDAIDDICENLEKEYDNMKDIYLQIKKIDVLESGYVSVSNK
jgi:dihydroneopterin aldolase